MRIAVGLMMLGLAACEPAAAPVAEVEARVDGAAPALMPPVELGGVDFSQPIRALGTEPFWAVEIKPDALVYSGVDRPETKMTNPGPRMEGGAAVIAADAGGQPFTITLRESQCSDGMSDRVYPLDVQVLYMGETLKGCANSQAALDALPPP